MQTEAINATRSVAQMRAKETAVITAIDAPDADIAELASHGLAIGAELRFVKTAPLGDPIQLRVSGGNICIRKKDAARIRVASKQEAGGAAE